MVAGFAVLLGLVLLLYLAARAAPSIEEDDLERIRLEKGERRAERHRQMELQRHYTLLIGRVVWPIAAAGLAISLIIELVG